jgi:hypothetical protein
MVIRNHVVDLAIDVNPDGLKDEGDEEDIKTPLEIINAKKNNNTNSTSQDDVPACFQSKSGRTTF